MVDIEKLKEIGISNTEAKIYFALLKLGEATVTEISQKSGLHRTNIYDSLEKLKEKGLVSYLSKENKQFVRATNPENLLMFLQEQEERIAKIIPELKEIQSKIPEKVTIEIFKGKQGIKSVLKDILLKKEEVTGYSISGQLRQFLPDFAKYYFREQTKYKIMHRFIYTTGIAKPPSKYYEIKYLPKEFTSTTINLCYADMILNLIWEPELVAIRIKSKELANNFKKHFNLLWSIAKK
ncbi:MAG: ArsR family transcriptional regulator [Nanoarchaeota archaeon]|nr:ArsR family transcriptional regulator [Nanoarchaeota archaeon]